MRYGHDFFIADIPSAIVCVLGAVSSVLIARRIRIPAAVSSALAAFGLVLYFAVRETRSPRVWGIFSPTAHALIPPTIVLLSFGLVCSQILLMLRDAIPPFRSERRDLLRSVTAAACASPAAILGIAVITRKQVQVREIELAFPELPKDLHGLRLVQLSDIHLGPFFSRADLARVIDESNNLRGDMVFITGDLITTPWDPLDACIQELRRLRSSSGVWGCMGNHEMYCQAQGYTELKAKRYGIEFLRHSSAQAKFGNSSVNLVGVDYQPEKSWYLQNVDPLVAMGSFNLLLSHNPDVFPVAASKGFDLTLAGHTHGGQINLEILGTDLNLADFYTPYTKGLYTLPMSQIYVNSGLGTIGVPARLGAPAEIAAIRLVRG